MSAGPIQRIAGAVGLAVLAPTAYLLSVGSLSPADAAWRALVTLVAAVLVGRVADRSLARLADVLDQQDSGEDGEDADTGTSVASRRRSEAQG